jgi:hypothetical protein
VSPAEPLRRVMEAVDGWQRRTRWAGVPYGVVKKFGDDNANLLVVALPAFGDGLDDLDLPFRQWCKGSLDGRRATA